MFIPGIGYMDIGTLILIGLALSFIQSLFNRKSNVYTGLRLTQYEINTANPGRLVSIEGEGIGIIAKIMGLFGFGNQYKINVTQRFVNIKAYNRTDEDTFSIPITSISAIYYGYARPRFALFIGIPLILLGLANLFGGQRYTGGLNGTTLFFLAMGAAIIYFLYWKMQTIEVRVSPGDGNWFGYSFLAGSAGTLEKARETALIIQNLIHASTANPNANETIL